jgi:hypothetical protein
LVKAASCSTPPARTVSAEITPTRRPFITPRAAALATARVLPEPGGPDHHDRLFMRLLRQRLEIIEMLDRGDERDGRLLEADDRGAG